MVIFPSGEETITFLEYVFCMRCYDKHEFYGADGVCGWERGAETHWEFEMVFQS